MTQVGPPRRRRTVVARGATQWALGATMLVTGCVAAGCGTSSHAAAGSAPSASTATPATATAPPSSDAPVAAATTTIPGRSPFAPASTVTAATTASTRRSVPPSTVSPTTAGRPSRAHLELVLVGIPAKMVAGAAPLVFHARFTNAGGTAITGIAPLFQVVGGACNCIQGSLQRMDAGGVWEKVAMPEGDGANPLLSASGPLTVGPGASVTVAYRLTVAADNPPKPASALLYAVHLPTHTKVADISVDTYITR